MLVGGQVGRVQTGWGLDVRIDPRPKQKEVERPFDIVAVLGGEERRVARELALRGTGAPEGFVDAEWDVVDRRVLVTEGLDDLLMTFPESDDVVGVLHPVLEEHPRVAVAVGTGKPVLDRRLKDVFGRAVNDVDDLVLFGATAAEPVGEVGVGDMDVGVFCQLPKGFVFGFVRVAQDRVEPLGFLGFVKGFRHAVHPGFVEHCPMCDFHRGSDSGQDQAA